MGAQIARGVRWEGGVRSTIALRIIAFPRALWLALRRLLCTKGLAYLWLIALCELLVEWATVSSFQSNERNSKYQDYSKLHFKITKKIICDQDLKFS